MHDAQARVLVLDDFSAIVEELLTLMSLHGIPGMGASNLGEAVTVLERSPEISVIACDLRLDRESGLDIVSRVREHPELRTRHFEYLFITGDQMRPEMVSGTSCYMILTKPVQPQELIRMIRKLLASEAPA
ncbi:response regulator [Novosphingobium aerophilum]|uniref:response regulator n=1 Tax=Novosphingobium TaxID=165696 RepID=UPI0006C84DC9|nr:MULTISPECIES: response regulator [unclassified Novosphingobium]KPH65882.1 histidine kinase [Novosphingobium sp. ST904]TCM35233.1 response regulator receiver domain-containing protein [Novosphingobium sp. ST904]WRT94856.1 response regulator [Novosphingobium sp. RL4]